MAGGIVGAWVTAVLTVRVNRAAALEQRRDTDQANAAVLRQLLMTIYSTALSATQDLDRGKQRQLILRTPHISMATEPVANEPIPVHFEVNLFVTAERIGGRDLLNAIATLDRQHNAISAIQRLYRERRLLVTDQWSVADLGGNPNTALLTDDELRHYLPKILALDSMIEQLAPMCEELISESLAALELLIAAQYRHHRTSIAINVVGRRGEGRVLKTEDRDANGVVVVETF